MTNPTFDMYQENILDHAQMPRHWGLLSEYDLHAHDDNPLCGDHLELTIALDAEDRVREVGWDGNGCAISQASASLLGEHIMGRSLEEVKALSKEDILTLLGIPLTPNRLKCALLSLKVVKMAAYRVEG